MDISSDEAVPDDLSGSELEAYEAKVYEDLRSISLRNRSGEIRCPFCPQKRKHPSTRMALFRHAASFAASVRRRPSQRASHRALARLLQPPIPRNPRSARTHDGEEDRFVWPWMGLVINVPDGGDVKNQLSDFNPLRIICLADSKCIIMEFDPDWAGFARALMFENFMVSRCAGKKQWVEHGSRVEKRSCGWMLRIEDYNENGKVGEHLRGRGDVHLRTVAEIVQDDEANLQKHVDVYNERIAGKKRSLNLMQCSLEKVISSMENVQSDIKRNHQSYNEDMWNLREVDLVNAGMLCKENQKLRLELDLLTKQLHVRCKQLRQVLFGNENPHRYLMSNNEEPKEGCLTGRIHFQRQFKKNKWLEMEMKYVKVSYELEETRALLIANAKKLLKGATELGIKRVGQLDLLPFKNACKEKFHSEDFDARAAELCSFWQEELGNPEWHPFKLVHYDGEAQEIIDEDDEKLQNLRNEFGDYVYSAVKTALEEIKEYDPRARCIRPELWNFKESRKATLKEVFEHILGKQGKGRKQGQRKQKEHRESF